MSIDLILNGCAGRVGKEVLRCAAGNPAMRIVGCVETAGHPDIGKDAGVVTGLGNIGVDITSDIEILPVETSVIVDFTIPSATEAFLLKIMGRQARIVVGTTGFSDEQVDIIRRAAVTGAVVFSPNMSLGVNLLFYLTELAARRLAPKFDVEIIEAHHRNKKDAPSGTAKRLGEIAADALGQPYEKAVCHGRSGMPGERTPLEIGMHAVRGGDIVGDHTVLFAGPGERLELRHTAHSRATFAQGALIAAQWLVSRKPGLYSMRDVLDF